MCARSSRFSTGKKYFTPYTVPQKLMFISQRKSSSEISSNVPSSATPALLISRVTHPCFFLTSFANRHMAFSSATSKMWVVISRSEEHTSELQSRFDLVCRLLLEKKKTLDTKSAFKYIY